MIAAGILLALAATMLGFAGLGMTGHMAAHMGAVALAAPVLALSPSFPRRREPRTSDGCVSFDGPARLDCRLRGNDGLLGAGGPLGWATIEFVVVWAWHAPALRDLADTHVAVALIEQAMFLIVGVGLWRAAFAHPAGGVAALLLTSMHMTLLGALIGLASRPLYAMMAMHPAPGLDALTDQQLGGVVMLVIGGAVYCLGGLALLGTLLRERAAA
ncbi:putative membrane protein [Sphingomonas sp. BE138]|uniref:cytochrome c oxidase assembly protein n=1 Tax=Sphingomonas sp. BE138 TaxID=2817845 RepID=UPI002858976A|nr:cytochrome c oxidase assembly protein [Sphingomonas sp. BE138]MDR6788315.1 putative membrane protein [Sphingomonas sp. BE138]